MLIALAAAKLALITTQKKLFSCEIFKSNTNAYSSKFKVGVYDLLPKVTSFLQLMEPFFLDLFHHASHYCM